MSPKCLLAANRTLWLLNLLNNSIQQPSRSLKLLPITFRQLNGAPMSLGHSKGIVQDPQPCAADPLQLGHLFITVPGIRFCV